MNPTENLGTIQLLSAIDPGKSLDHHVLEFDSAFVRCVSSIPLFFELVTKKSKIEDSTHAYAGILFGYAEQCIAKGQLDTLISEFDFFSLFFVASVAQQQKTQTKFHSIDEGAKYFDLSADKPFVRDVTVLRLEAISEQIYRKGISAASRAVSYALQIDTQLYNVSSFSPSFILTCAQKK